MKVILKKGVRSPWVRRWVRFRTPFALQRCRSVEGKYAELSPFLCVVRPTKNRSSCCTLMVLHSYLARGVFLEACMGVFSRLAWGRLFRGSKNFRKGTGAKPYSPNVVEAVFSAEVRIAPALCRAVFLCTKLGGRSHLHIHLHIRTS
jgi:hypothetical protein